MSECKHGKPLYSACLDYADEYRATVIEQNIDRLRLVESHMIDRKFQELWSKRPFYTQDIQDKEIAKTWFLAGIEYMREQQTSTDAGMREVVANAIGKAMTEQEQGE